MQGNRFVLYANNTFFEGSGKCVKKSKTKATFVFALDDDRNYVFKGSITGKRKGPATLKADQIKKGKVIDHLVMSR